MNVEKNDKKIDIYDTTLRDGQQSPNAGMSKKDNIKYAKKAIEDVGVDILEAGFPASSSIDFDIVNEICEELGEVLGAKISALCQLREKQIEETMEALEPAKKQNNARVHTYFPVDKKLVKSSIGDIDKNKIIENVYNYIKKIVEQGYEAQFSPEGYSNVDENFDFVTDLIKAAIQAGGSVINCPDTKGQAHYLQGEDYFINDMKTHSNIVEKQFDREISWSVHNHNDLGQAVENSIRGVVDGPASQIECTTNGVGERAGNAALEQIAMQIDQYGKKAGISTDINLQALQDISDFVAERMLSRQPHFPITGENAAKVTSGGHTNAYFEDVKAYQPFDPKKVGKDGVDYVFGPQSGGNHAQKVINSRIDDEEKKCSDEEKAQVAQFIKDYHSDKRKGISDEAVMEAYYEYRKQKKEKINVK